MHMVLRGLVLLTFDDGPSTKWTALLLDLLAKENSKGVLFVSGKQVASPGYGSWWSGHLRRGIGGFDEAAGDEGSRGLLRCRWGLQNS